MWGKGALGASQIAGGILLGLAPAGALTGLAQAMARMELVEDPNDPLALWLMNTAAHLPATPQAFYILYLIIHGALNLGLVLALLAGLRAAYPLSILALVGFVGYQIWKYSHTGDPLMLLLSVIDVVVIGLIWREWRLQDRPV